MACHTSRSSQGLSASSCWSFCEATPKRSAMGSIDLPSPGSNSPSTYSAAPSRRSLRPIGRAKGARKPGNAFAWARQFASVHFITEKTTAATQRSQYTLNIVILDRRLCLLHLGLCNSGRDPARGPKTLEAAKDLHLGEGGLSWTRILLLGLGLCLHSIWICNRASYGLL